MKQLGVVWLVLVLALGSLAYSVPLGNVIAQDGDAAATEVAVLRTEVAVLRTEVADLRTRVAESGNSTGTAVPTLDSNLDRGRVVYQADTESGFDEWPRVSGWKLLDGMLLNDGTDLGAVAAPYKPEGLTNYAVEVEIQVISGGCRTGFAIFGRGAYYGYIDYPGCSYRGGVYLTTGTEPSNFTQGTPGVQLAKANFDPGSDWHTYRLECEGNQIRFLVDGAVIIEAIDNRYLEGGTVGLISLAAQLNVRSFKVIVL